MIELVGGKVETAPYTQQREGCSKPGDKIYLPFSYLLQNSSDTGRILSNLWIRLRYGVFGDIESDSILISRQYAQCEGRGAREVVFQHKDFSNPRYPVNFTLPRIHLIQRTLPKFIIILENSVEMNLRDHWDHIRTACKKFILHDLPDQVELGLVLFNEEAHISHPVGRLGKKMISSTRNGLAFSIRNKHSLSPRSGSCVKCGVDKGVEALRISGATSGGVLLLISRGDTSNLSILDQDEIKTVLYKHHLQLYPVSIPEPHTSDLSIPLENLAHWTGGKSFLISDNSQPDNPQSTVYMDLVDSLREILEHTVPYSSQLVSIYNIYV